MKIFKFRIFIVPLHILSFKTLPFPQRFIKYNLDKQFGKFLNHMKDITNTIPFMDAIRDMPSWGKFLKDIINHKGKMEEYGLVSLVEESKAMFSRTPPKLKDPSSFTIPYRIGDLTFNKVLCNIGASVSLMPYSIYEKIDLGELKPTTRCLSMADKSIKYSLGVLENVPTKVGKFIIHADFVVMDMEEDLDIPILLGRLVLVIAGVVIDMKNGKFKVEVNDESIVFYVYKMIKTSLPIEVCG